MNKSSVNYIGRFLKKKTSFFSSKTSLKEYYWLGKKAEGLFTQPLFIQYATIHS